MWRRKNEPKQKKKWQVEISEENGSGEEDEFKQEKDSEEAMSMSCMGSCKASRESDVFCVTCKGYYCFDDFTEAHKPAEDKKKEDYNNREHQEAKEKVDRYRTDFATAEIERIQALPSPPQTEGSSTSSSPSSSSSSSSSSTLPTLPEPDKDPKVGEIRQGVHEKYDKQLREELRKTAHIYRGLIGTDKEALDGLSFGRFSGQDLCQWERLEDKHKKEEEEQSKRKRAEEDEVAAKRPKTGIEGDGDVEENGEENEGGQDGEQSEAARLLLGEGGGDIDSNLQALLNREENDRTVFVSNIAWEAKTSDVRNFFRQCGRIVEVVFPKVGAQQRTAPHRGLAIIEFDTAEAAAKSLVLNGAIMLQRPIRVIRHQSVPSPAAMLAGTANESDRRAIPYKVKMCHHFERGSCHKGEDCSFAHHPRELPPSTREMLARARGMSAPSPSSVPISGPFRGPYRGRGGAPRGRGGMGGMDGGYKW